MPINRKKERYHYCIEMENALCQFRGRKYEDWATLCEDPKLLKRALLDVTKVIRKRLHSISMDTRLELTTSTTLESLATEIKEIGEDFNNDLEIIAKLLDFISRLLCFGWQDGKIHREVVYFQTKEQENEDFRHLDPNGFWDTFDQPLRERERIVLELKDKNIHNNVIARTMNISEYKVNQILHKHGRIKAR